MKTTETGIQTDSEVFSDNPNYVSDCGESLIESDAFQFIEAGNMPVRNACDEHQPCSEPVEEALSSDKEDPPNPVNLINNETDKGIIISASEERIDQDEATPTRVYFGRRASLPKNYDFKKYLNDWRQREGSLTTQG